MCGRDGYENEWRSKKKYAIGGHFGEQGIHLVDLVRYLAHDIDEVCSMNNIGYFKKQNLEDNGSAILKLKNGAIATINSSMIEWKNSFNMSIFGTEGYIFLDGLGGTYGEQKITYGKREFSKPFEDKTVYFRGGDKSWSNEWNHFIKQMKLKHRSDDSGFKSVLIIEKTYESQKKKKVYKSLKKKLICTSFNSQFSRDLEKNHNQNFDLFFLSKTKNSSKKNIFSYTSTAEIPAVIRKKKPDIIWHNMAISQQKKKSFYFLTKHLIQIF